MDNPSSSLFQGPDIKINNSQNNEEEEDIEDQRRRKEELQHLLTAALDDFNYDESTVNSTNISVASFDEVQSTYKHASEPNEQLKMLYDIRLKELSNLKEEYNNYKEEKTKEINTLKNKLLLFEADVRQMKVSQKNSENLLVEKTSKITELNTTINNKDMQITEYEKIIENLQFEVCTYQSNINELQIKLQGDNNPFNVGAKKFNSEELQNAHREQIIRLETLLNDQIRSAKVIEKEKVTLQHDLQNLIELKNKVENDDKDIIQGLTKTLEDAQQQCKDLINVVEMLTKENQHMQDRIDASRDDSQDIDYNIHTMDEGSLLKHIEKLKKMMLTKSVKIDSLNSKLKHYESDMKELLEYRQLKCDTYKQEFQQCENKEHTKSLLLMQNDLQNYRRTIEDKNQQILTLNSTNRDLQGKIEDMLLQTRNDIQNLSHKYSLPQLEQMAQELRNAEEKVKEVQEKLNKSEERRLSLVQKLERNENIQKEFQSQLLNVKNNADKEKMSLENQLTKIQKELDISAAEIKNLKQFTEALIDENTKLKLEIKENVKVNKSTIDSHEISENGVIRREYEQLKEQLNQVMAHLEKNKSPKESSTAIIALKYDMEQFVMSLKETVNIALIQEKVDQWKKILDGIKIPNEKMGSEQEDYEQIFKKLQRANSKIRALEETIDDLRNAKIIEEGEKCSYQFQVKDCENQLEHACKTIEYLETETDKLTKAIKEKDEIIEQLKNSTQNELDQLKDQLSNKENALKLCEADKSEVNDLLLQVRVQLEESKKELFRLQKEVAEASDKAVRRNLEKELKEAENHLEQSRIEDGDVSETEHFKKCLQAEILKNELKLREGLQQEYLRKIKEVEAKYQKVCSSTTNLHKEQIQKMKNQEVRYREHLSKILSECAKKISEFENDRLDLISQINYLKTEYDEYKRNVSVTEKNYKQLLLSAQRDAERNVEEWKKWSKSFVSNCLKIETFNKSSRDSILLGIKNVDGEIAAIEKCYKEKVKKCLKNEKH